MGNSCFNLNDSTVVQYLNSINNKDLSYYLYYKNNNNLLNEDLNGKESKLFKDLLSYYDGDIQAAYLAKAKIFSESFLSTNNWIKTGIEPSITDVLGDNEYSLHEVDLSDNTDFLSNYQEQLSLQRANLILSTRDIKNDKETLNLLNSLDRIGTDITQLELNDIRAALLLTGRYNLKRLKDIVSRIQKYKNIDWNSETITKKQREEISKFLINANNFIESYAEISNLKYLNKKDEETLGIEIKDDFETRRNNIIKKELRSEAAKINAIIRNINTLQDKINSAKKDLDIISTKMYVKSSMELTYNKELSEAELINPQIDSTYIQKLLDTLTESNNPLVANQVKYFRMITQDGENTAKRLIQEFKEKTEEFLKTNTFNNIVDRKTGQFVGSHRIHDYLEAKTKYFKDMETMVFDNEFEKNKYKSAWYKKNLKQKYSNEFYDLLDTLPDEFREKLKPINEKVNEITKKVHDNSDLVDSERVELRKLKDEKTAIIKELQVKYNFKYYDYIEKLFKFYKDSGVKNTFFDKVKKLTDLDSTKIFLQRNFRLNQDFWDNFNSIIALFGTSENSAARKQIRIEIKALLNPYKDENGNIMGHLVPEDIKEAVSDLKNEEMTLMKEAKGEGKNPRIEALIKRLNNLASFEGNEYYIKERQKVINNLKAGESLEDTAWYKENHIFSNYSDSFVPQDWYMTVMANQSKEELLNMDENGQVTYSYFYDILNVFEAERELKDEYINNDYDENDRDIQRLNDSWVDGRFSSLSTQESNYLSYVKDLVTSLSKDKDNSITNQNYIPAILNNTDNVLQDFVKSLKFSKVNKQNKTVFFDRNGKELKEIPFSFIYKIEHKDKIDLPEHDSNNKEDRERVLEEINLVTGFNFKSYNEIIKYNLNVDNYNKKISNNHAENISYRLDEVIPMFIDSAVKHNTAKTIENDMLFFYEYLKRSKLKKSNYKGEGAIDLTLSVLTNSKKEVIYEAGEASNIVKQFEYEIDKLLYSDYIKDEGKLTAYSKVIQNYVSKLNIGFNISSALNNVAYGKIQMTIESIASSQYNYKDYGKARAAYDLNMMNFLADSYTGQNSSLISGIINYYDIFESQADTVESDKYKGLKEEHNNLKKFLYKTNPFFLMQNLGEHMMQNQVLLSMLFSHRIHNGRIVNLNQFIEESQVKIDKNLSKEEKKKLILSNKESKKSFTEQFNSLPKLLERKDGEYVSNVFKFSKHGVKINNDLVSESELSLFKLKCISQNHKLHGIYNKADAGLYQKTILGRLGMQFRKWARPGWNRRFGSKFGKTNFNEIRGEKDKGSYVSLYDFLVQPIRDNKPYTYRDAKVVFNAITGIIKGYGDYIANAKIHWGVLTLDEKQRVRSATAEMLFLISVTIILNGLRKMGDDDDNKKDGMFYSLAMFQLSRLTSELKTFMPIAIDKDGLTSGWINESKKMFSSPAASFGFFGDVLRLVSATYNLGNPEKNKFKNGVYRKEYEAKIYLIKVIPGLRQAQRLKYIEEMNQYYRLY